MDADVQGGGQVRVLAALLLAAAPTQGAGAQDGAAGRWQGTVALGDREVAVAVDLAPAASGGTWTGSIVLSGLGVKGAPLSAIAVEPPNVGFVLASPRGEQGLNLRVEAKLEGERLEGTLMHSGRSTPLSLRRTGEAQVDVPLASTPVAERATGEWLGEYELFGYPRKVTLRLRNEKSAARASFLIVGRRNNDLAVDLVRQEGETVFVVSSATGIRFEGRVSADGSEMSGALLQGPLEIPLTLRRSPGASS
jgi:hypothetical protein